MSAKSRIAELEKRVAELEAALKPFAACAEVSWYTVTNDESIVLSAGTRVNIPTIGDCRRAAKVLGRAEFIEYDEFKPSFQSGGNL